MVELLLKDGRMKAVVRTVGTGTRRKVRLTIEFPDEAAYFRRARAALAELIRYPADVPAQENPDG